MFMSGYLNKRNESSFLISWSDELVPAQTLWLNKFFVYLCVTGYDLVISEWDPALRRDPLG